MLGTERCTQGKSQSSEPVSQVQDSLNNFPQKLQSSSGGSPRIERQIPMVSCRKKFVSLVSMGIGSLLESRLSVNVKTNITMAGSLSEVVVLVNHMLTSSLRLHTGGPANGRYKFGI